jgi:hypothetical protein
MKQKQLFILFILFTSVLAAFAVRNVPSVSATTQTRYLRSDTWTQNGLFSNQLGTSETSNTDYDYVGSGFAYTCKYGLRIFIRDTNGVERELTSGTPVWVGTRTVDGSGLQSTTWSVPQTILNTTDVLEVRDEFQRGSQAVQEIWQWTTEQLGYNILSASTWTLQLYTKRNTVGSNDYYIFFGDATHDSEISNIVLSTGVSITITSSPTGSGYVTVDGGAITTPQTYVWNISESHTIAANSPANTVTGQTQYIWKNWSDSGAQSHSYTVPGGDATVTANFQLQYYLTVQGGNSPSGQGWYNSSLTTNVTNTWIWNIVSGQSRTALTNYYLDNAAQNPSRSNTGNYTTPTITMSNYHNVTFTNLTQHYLTVTGGNNIAYGTASPTGDNWYDSGTTTTVSSNWVWSTINGQSRTAVTNYAVDGVGQNPARKGAGTLTTGSVTFATYHTVVFSSGTQYYVTLGTGTVGTTVGQSGSQTSDNWYDSGSSASVSATTPYMNGTVNRFVFLNWMWTRAGVAQTNSSNNPFSITMSNYANATAYWSEDSVDLFSYSITSQRVNVSDTVYINLTYRWSSDHVLLGSGFTIKVNGISHTIMSGWTNFTDTSATVQTVRYQLTQAEGGAFYVNSASPTETWERVKIVSGGISATYVHVGTNVLVYYELEYESDSSLVTDGNVLLNGTGMTYNSSLTRWEENTTSPTIASNYYSVSAVSGNLYGITVINDTVGTVGTCVWYANLNLRTVDVASNPLTQAVVYMSNGTTAAPPGVGSIIIGGVSGYSSQLVSADGWANYTGQTNSTVTIFAKWYGLTVNQTFTLNFNVDTALNITCLAYPFTVNAVRFWAASNATITASSYSGNILTLSFSASLNNYTLISSCPIIPRYILNATYDIATSLSTYLSLAHYGNATLTLSYESWSDLYVQSTDQTLTSVSIVNGQLLIVPKGTNGTISTLKVHCGALGNPTVTEGFTTGTFGSSIYTGTYVINGQTLILGWAVSPFIGGGTTGVTGPTISVNIAFTFPRTATQGQVVNGTLLVTWSSYAMIFIWQVACAQPYSNWAVNLGDLPLALQTPQTEGNATLNVTLTIPANVADGNYQVPASVTFQTPTGLAKTVGSTISLTIGAVAPTTNLGIPYLVMAGFLGLFSMFLLTLFVRKNRSKKGQFGAS